MREHDKIINTAAKKILAPHGLFRKGTSRVWLDDNGYFMVQVEFQPSGWSKGSHLNVGIGFLWEKCRELNDLLSFDFGYRVKGFVPYREEDDGFEVEMERFAETALQKVMEYRKFKDMTYAQKCLHQRVLDTPITRQFWELYDLAMLSFLMGDFDRGMESFDALRNRLNVENDVERQSFYHYFIHDIQVSLESKDTAQTMVLDMIKRRRAFFNNKASFQKMNKEAFLLS